MKMCYDGALVMPQNFSVVTADEMEYIDGGLYLSNSTLWECCRVAFCTVAVNPIGATLIALGAYKAYTYLAAGVARIAGKLALCSKALGIAFGVLGVTALLTIGFPIIDALMQGKGIEIGIKYTAVLGIPYGFYVSVK